MTNDELTARKNKKRLLDYYSAELQFLRRQAGEFAARYPELAGGLKLGDAHRPDPHVERLLEGVALLAGRVRAKLDDEFPELTDALLGILYPHLLAPVPSMAVVQFDPPPGSVDLAGGLSIPRHTELVSAPLDGVPCRFRTGYGVTLWPLRVAAATVSSYPLPPTLRELAPAARAVLSLKLRTTGAVPLDQTGPGTARPSGPGAAEGGDAGALRVFLAGDPVVTATLYEYLFNNVVRVAVRNPRTGAACSADVDQATRIHPWVRPVGFAAEEALLPYPRQVFPGYRVLTEFFAYREKFLFADLGGWAAARAAGAAAGAEVEYLVFFDQDVPPEFLREVTADTFRLGCTPAVNLFEKLVEVVPLTQRTYEYPVVPDRHHWDGYEVYSVDDVSQRNPVTGREVAFAPFYSFRHQSHDPGRAYWYARRRPSTRTAVVGGAEVPDPGTEVDLCFVDLGFDPSRPAADLMLIRATCLNRDLPTRWRTQARGGLQFEDRGQYGAVRVLSAPTPTLRPPPRTGAYWRLVSHLALNHLSITHPDEGRDALREYLRLYDFANPEVYPELTAVNRQVVDGLERVDSRPAAAFTRVATGAGYVRGVEVSVRLDQDKYEGVGAFLFASVLDRFLPLYASVNSFTRLTYHTRQQGNVPVKRWPPRTGTRPVL